MNLSQTITFFSVLFWAVVIGPIGAILAIPLTLLVRLFLVDSNPAMSWIRPMLGELDETKAVMAEFDAEAKAERKARASGTANGIPVAPLQAPPPAFGRAITCAVIAANDAQSGSTSWTTSNCFGA